MGLAAVLLMTACAAPATAQPRKSGPGIARMAGSFNNWSAGDNAYALKRFKDRLRLVRFWECGVYEFKFTFDGSWDRHFGSAGDDRLVQPGENIRLLIPQSGTYELWLNLEDRTWGIKRSQPRELVAYFRVVGAEAGVADVMLDGRISQASKGKEIDHYDWIVTSPDGEAMIDLMERPDLPPSLRLLKVRRPGRFKITLRVTEGGRTVEMTKHVRLGHGWSINWMVEKENEENLRTPREEDLRTPQAAGRADAMLPISGGAWCAVRDAGRAGNLEAAVNPAIPLKRIAPITASFQQSARQRIAARLDPEARRLTFHTEGYHLIRVNADGSPIDDDGPVERVDIVGDFNNWTPGITQLHETWDTARRFSCILELPEGVYHYKLLVNGTRLMEDPSADPRLRVSDGKSGFNSGFRVGPDAAEFGTPLPDNIACGAVRHDPESPAYLQPIGENLARIVVRTLKDDVESVVVDLNRERPPVSLHRTQSRFGFDYWSNQFIATQPVFEYTVTLADGEARSLLTYAACDKMPTEPDEKVGLTSKPFEADLRMSFQTPDWAKRVVWYQIFPERFCNGEKANDPPRTVPWNHAWDKPYDGSHAKDPARRFKEQGTFFQFIYDRRYGGDFQGIRQKLPYLRDLGITAIYLNPIFHAESLHKYDASDYRHIDDFFGVAGSIRKLKGETADPATWQWSESDRVFLEFLDEAHRLGFRVIIDGVFNHVGRDFWAFQDVLKHGRKSAYADWFDITSWEPFHYRAWDRDDGALPRLKHDDALGLCEPVRQHLFAVTRRWMDPNGDGDPSDGIDGWRLDVASDINANFWRDWRALVKSINPDAYIVAELWEESKVWLDGQTFDAVMNYPFARASQRFFVNDKKRITPAEFDRQLREVLSWYPPQVSYVLQNLFDSHDTDRVASMFMNPDLEYDQANRPQDNGPNYNPARPTRECYERLKLMVTHQLTYLGAPMIYYGGEVGMYGADDPSCRKPMLWPELLPYDDPDERIEQDVLEHHRRMIAIRNTYPALQVGSLDTLMTDDGKGIYAYARSLDGESVVVVLNNSGQQHRLDVPSPWPDGSIIVRLDDANEAEIVMPAEGDLKARPGIRAKNPHHRHVRVEGGHLRGMMLHAYSGAVLARIGK